MFLKKLAVLFALSFSGLINASVLIKSRSLNSIGTKKVLQQLFLDAPNGLLKISSKSRKKKRNFEETVSVRTAREIKLAEGKIFRKLGWSLRLSSIRPLTENLNRKLFFNLTPKGQETSAVAEDVSGLYVTYLSPRSPHTKHQLFATFNNQGEISRLGIEQINGKLVDLVITSSESEHLIKNKKGELYYRVRTNYFDAKIEANFTVFTLVEPGKENYLKYNFTLKKRALTKAEQTKEEKFTWELGHNYKIDGKISLSKDKTPEKDSLYILKSPITGIGAGLDGIFGTLAIGIYDLFTSGDGYKKKVKKVIIKEAKNTEIIDEYFSSSEIEEIATRVTEDTKLPKFAPFTRQKIIVKNTTKMFTRALMEKLLKEFLPDSSLAIEREKESKAITSDFYSCLDISKNKKASSSCVNKFERSAPYRLGHRLLEAHMQDNLKSQNLSNSEMEKIRAAYNYQYNVCAQEYYFVAFDRHNVQKVVNDKPVVFDGVNAIQSCLYSGVLEGVQVTTRIVIEKTLEKFIKNEKERESSLDKIGKNADGEFENQKFITNKLGFKEFRYDLLKKMEIDQFKAKILNIIDRVTVFAGSEVVRSQILETSLIRTMVADGDLNEAVFIETVMKEGYQKCLSFMPEKSPNPELCQAYIEIVTSYEVLKNLLKKNLVEMVGDKTDGYKKIVKALKIDQKVEANSCFKRQLKYYEDGLVRAEERALNSQGLANCGKLLIGDLVFHVTEIMIKKEMGEKVLGNVAIAGQEQLIHGHQSFARKCFIKEMDSFKDLEELGDGLDEVQRKCLTKIYKEVIPGLVTPVLESKLAGAVSDPALKQELISKLKEQLVRLINQESDPEKIMNAVSDFAAEATIQVIESIISNTLLDKFPEKDSNGKVIEKNMVLRKKLFQRLINPAFKSRIRRASATGDDYETDKAINDFIINAVEVIAPSVIKDKVAFFIKNPLLRQGLIANSIQELNSCLQKVTETNELAFDLERRGENGFRQNDIPKEIEGCVQNTTLSTTESVLRGIFNQESVLLKEQPQLRQHVLDISIESFKKCLRHIPRADSVSFDRGLDGCTSAAAVNFSRNLSNDFLTVIENIRRGEEKSRKGFNKCLDTLVDEVASRGGQSSTGSISTNLIFLNSFLGNPSIAISWVQKEINTCINKQLKKALAVEVRHYFVAVTPIKLNDFQRKLLNDSLHIFAPLLDFNIQLKENTSSDSDGFLEKTENGNMVKLADEIIKMISEFVSMAILFDPTSFVLALEDVKTEILELGNSGNQILYLEDVMEVLLKSKALDIVIKGAIAYKVKIQAEPLVKEFGVEGKFLRKISAKGMINYIFDQSVPGKTALEYLKKEYLRPLLQGKVTGDIPKVVMDRVKRALAADKRLGGFAEVILAELAQSKLNNANEDLNWAEWAVSRAWFGHRNSNFDWGTLRNKPHGKVALQYFSDHLLLPSLLFDEEISNDTEIKAHRLEIERKTGHLSKLIERAVNE
ncbi:MAG: hypothetical protein HN509_12855 [Halobacteriovoraceae bacterium]|jgi:hypothetical protein|nr:hypothetical protein [Halobacteriovoraceae bacterium]